MWTKLENVLHTDIPYHFSDDNLAFKQLFNCWSLQYLCFSSSFLLMFWCWNFTHKNCQNGQRNMGTKSADWRYVNENRIMECHCWQWCCKTFSLRILSGWRYFLPHTPLFFFCGILPDTNKWWWWWLWCYGNTDRRFFYWDVYSL